MSTRIAAALLAAALLQPALAGDTPPSSTALPTPVVENLRGAAAAAAAAEAKAPLRAGSASSGGTAAGVGPGLACRDAVAGEACWEKVQWAMKTGILEHPDWYPGLTHTSGKEQFQMAVHITSPGLCPAPCVSPDPALWCLGAQPPPLWAPDVSGTPLTVKVLSYNLFWWNLYGKRGGNGDSASKLIAAAMQPEPFDFMGFQECEDPARVLAPLGLDEYEAIQGPHAMCAAFRKAAWELLAHGEIDVGEDISSNFYGRRGAMWLRLRHRESGKFALFVNHHGPLSVNSGGQCGGLAVAHNLVHLMATEGRKGDALFLVGDFNANAASATIQGLWRHLVHSHNGASFGGVDNVFSNIAQNFVVRTENLGSGGSDHDAIATVFQLGGSDPIPGAAITKSTIRTIVGALAPLTGTGSPGDDWQDFWCGLVEGGMSYVVDDAPWSRRLEHKLPDTDVANPSRCCRLCQRESPSCRSWRWEKASAASGGPACTLLGGAPTGKLQVEGVTSGLAVAEAAALAFRASALAVMAMPPGPGDL